jgi:site-specific recombinase XerD
MGETEPRGLDLRAKAIIALLAWGGLRRAEVAALDVRDFDPAFGLRRVHGKGGHEDAVALPDGPARSWRRTLQRTARKSKGMREKLTKSVW